MLCKFTIFLVLSNAVYTNTSNKTIPKPKEYAERILRFGKSLYEIINSTDFSKSMDDMKAYFGKLRQQTTARNYEIDNQNLDADVKGCVEQIESNERFTPISVESLTKIDNITLDLMHWLSESNIQYYDGTAIALIYLATKIKKTYICCIAYLYCGVKEFNRVANEIFEDERVIDKSTELRKFEKHYNKDAQGLFYMFDKLDTYRQQIKEILEKYESALASQESSSLDFLSQPITLDLVKQHFSHIGTYHTTSAVLIICKLISIARYYDDYVVFINEVTQSMTFLMSFSIFEAKYFLKVIEKYIEQLKKVDPKCSYKLELSFWNDARLWQLRMYKTYIQRSLDFYTELLTDYNEKTDVQTVPMIIFDEDMRSLVDTYKIIQKVVNEALKVVPRICRKSTPNSYRIYAGFILGAIFCLTGGLYICTKIKRR